MEVHNLIYCRSLFPPRTAVNCNHTLCQHLLVTTTMMVALSLPIGLVTVHVYVPLSLVVTLSME